MTEPRVLNCRNFLPGDVWAGKRRCTNCLVPIEEHGGLDIDDLLKVSQRVYNLLMHYGHHCTVQNYLPDLRAAILKSGGVAE